ncbi:hypothetical protein BGW36DRAFT_334899 [Talaromyces proteolyticus]|uniref:NAD-dependent epimerase/dehydratase domain-containing protein n=1 Tax=Talaromyces proteolyticus TaxID=1131652 RepID=A0AAD4KZF2_9EURO|nr:uncharacterized protein BGW36DRAFT_334899 [Talaromyces proteolyticus]KAH8703867.1 hypothetical protein BGW36DRAFT_334899 [Talaromyces proteolyticus]
MTSKTRNVDCEHILITGVTGYIGFKTLSIALTVGYRVRAVVRNEANIKDLKNRDPTVVESLERGQLHFVVIPDFLVEDAIFNHLDGITVLIHIASPLAIETNDYDAGIIKPALSMVTTVLEAAARVSSIRRVVLTSSCVTLVPFEWNMNPDSDRLYTVADINTNTTGPFLNAMQAYWASKALTRLATKEFVRNNCPQFDFINLLPSVVIGPDDRLNNDPTATIESLLQGTRAAVLAPALTSSLSSPFPYVGVPVHVADVAWAHIDAIDADLVPGNSEYILCSDTPDGVVWDRDVANIARKFFQKEVTTKVLPLEGSLTTIKWRLDAQSTEEVFGWKFTSFEDTMKELLAQYLELQARNNAVI